MYLDSFHTSSDFCYLLISFANSSDPDQDRQNDGHDLDPNCQLQRCSCKNFLILKKSADNNKSMKNYPVYEELQACEKNKT